MEKLNLTLLERLGELEAQQGRMALAILDLQERLASTAEPRPAKTALADSMATWSARGLNMRLPRTGTPS